MGSLTSLKIYKASFSVINMFTFFTVLASLNSFVNEYVTCSVLTERRRVDFACLKGADAQLHSAFCSTVYKWVL